MHILGIVKDKANELSEELIKLKGKTIFEIGKEGLKDIEFHPLDNSENPNKEFVVEMPLRKESTAIDHLKLSINTQHLLNTCKGIKMLLVINSPDFDVKRGSYMVENLIGFQRAFLPTAFTE